MLGRSLLAVTLLLGSPSARADGASEAYSHFQRAVTLYSESDFTAALVEFKRAYALAPANTAGTINVLFNIGQAQFQLQKYAEALATFEKYLSDGGTTHSAEAESAIATLRDRVGRVDVTTNVPADIQVDDETAGKTPLSAPLTVSVGRRKITAIAEGSLPATAWVEVPSGEGIAVTLKLDVKSDRVAGAPPAEDGAVKPPLAPAPNRTAAIVGWIATGVLGVGVGITGFLALQSSQNLSSARNEFPANPNTVRSDASTTTALSVTTDALGVATLVMGVLSIYWTVASAPSNEVRVGASGNGVNVFGTF
jgi:tetratricopeptide (TPR) repeat protein